MAGAATAGKVPETPREEDGDTPDGNNGVEPDGKLASVGKKRTRTGCLNCRRKRRKCMLATLHIIRCRGGEASLSISETVGCGER